MLFIKNKFSLTLVLFFSLSFFINSNVFSSIHITSDLTDGLSIKELSSCVAQTSIQALLGWYYIYFRIDSSMNADIDNISKSYFSKKKIDEPALKRLLGRINSADMKDYFFSLHELLGVYFETKKIIDLKRYCSAPEIKSILVNAINLYGVLSAFCVQNGYSDFVEGLFHQAFNDILNRCKNPNDKISLPGPEAVSFAQGLVHGNRLLLIKFYNHLYA